MPFKKASSFTYPPRLVVSVEGLDATGKTHFPFGAPRPLYLFNIDAGLEGMMQEPGKFDLARVYVSDFALSKPVALTQSDAVEQALAVAKRFIEEFREKLRKEKRITLAVDTASEFWELFRLGDLGKLEQVPPMRYTKVNRMWRGMMLEVFQTPHNLILIHRLKDKYESKMVNGKEVSTRVAGELERVGFKETDYVVQVSIRCWRKVRQKEGPRKGQPLFGFTVIKCRQRASLMGKTFVGDTASFKGLAMAVFPESTEEDWT